MITLSDIPYKNPTEIRLSISAPLSDLGFSSVAPPYFNLG